MQFIVSSYKDLGIRTDNLRVALLPWTLLTLIYGCSLLVLLNSYAGAPLLKLWHDLYSSIFILFILATAQELFFRGYLMHVLRSAYTSSAKVILIDVLLFAAMHAVFPHPEIVVSEALVAGLGFATVYYYYPNVILASVAHIILTWVIIPFCFFGLVSC